jgi:hypothetical protein
LAAFEAFAWDGVQIAGFEYGNCDNWLSRFLSGIIYLNAALVVQKPEVHAMLLKMSDEFATPEAFAKKIIRETDNHYSAIAYKFRDRVVKK